MSDYSAVQSGDDSYAPEHIGGLGAAAPIDEYVDFGLDVSANGDGTVSISEGKFYIILDDALAEWTGDSGTYRSQTIDRVLMYGHFDALSKDLAATDETNYVWAWLNYQVNNDPRILVKTGAAPPTHPDSGDDLDDIVEVARVDPTTGETEPRNQNPNGVFGSVTATTELVDPSGRSHQGEMADVSDVRTDDEVHALAQDRVDAYDHYDDQRAVAAVNATDELETGVSGAAGSVAGEDVSGAVAEAQHATRADNATRAGGVNPSNWLRTDVRDKLGASVDANAHRIENLDGLTFSASSGTALDLTPGSDGSFFVWRHDDPDSGREFGVQSNPGGGQVLHAEETGGPTLFDVETDGDVRAPSGDVFAQDGRLASQQWTNSHFHQSGQPLDLAGEALAGVDGIQAQSGRIDIYDATNVRGDLQERGERVATQNWAKSHLQLRGHDHDDLYYRKGTLYTRQQSDNRYARRDHDHDDLYYRKGQTYSEDQADGRFSRRGHDHYGEDIRPNTIRSSGDLLFMDTRVDMRGNNIYGISDIGLGEQAIIHGEDGNLELNQGGDDFIYLRATKSGGGVALLADDGALVAEFTASGIDFYRDVNTNGHAIN